VDAVVDYVAGHDQAEIGRVEHAAFVSVGVRLSGASRPASPELSPRRSVRRWVFLISDDFAAAFENVLRLNPAVPYSSIADEHAVVGS